MVVWHVPQSSNWHHATDQLRCGVCIITLKQPSNNSSIPFQKSEINKNKMGIIEFQGYGDSSDLSQVF